MKAFDSSSLWRISQFRKARNEGRLDLEQGGDRATLLPTTLLADLRRLQSEGADGDVLEVIARRASAIARRRCCTSSTASSSGR